MSDWLAIEGVIEPILWGETTHAILRPATEDTVHMPVNLAHAPWQADLTGAWEALTPGMRHELLDKVATAKAKGTHDKRIAALVAELGGAR